MYPTDVAKTQAQLHTGGQLTMLQSLRKTVAERGVSGLYRGLASPIVAEAPKRAVKFSCNEQYKGMLRGADGSLSSGRAGLAGSLAGTTEAFVNCPFEVGGDSSSVSALCTDAQANPLSRERACLGIFGASISQILVAYYC